jgi:malonate-semialdehyde dehydrogenase (acetylating)/methylmalonate-semialdehyde dehydrogenase
MTGSSSSLPIVRHWIDGKPFDGMADRLGDVYDPATGELTKRVAFASVADVDQAVASATTAFATWRHSSLARRSKILFAFREIVVERASELAAIVTAEHGKVPSAR